MKQTPLERLRSRIRQQERVERMKIKIPDLVDCRGVHKFACNHCPSAHFEPTPDSVDILTLPHKERVKTAFRCAWRPGRFCKGYCDLMGISEADLESDRMACVASDEEFIEVERARVQRAAMIITKADRIRYREDFRVMGSGC